MAVFKQRRGTAAALAAANEVPAAGQIIYETDTNRMKVGNGSTPYSSLPYLDSDVTIADVTGLQAALDGKQAAGSYAALAHTHIKSEVGLGNVDNTSDANKPVSTAQAADATSKANAAQAFAIQRSNHTGTQAISTVVGLQTALDGKAASSHTHTIANVTGLQTALDGKQAVGSYAALVHVHAVADVTGLQAILDGKQPSGSYAAAVHTHAIADTTGLQAALDSKQAAGTYATLVGGTVPSSQLPSYVDDVLEYANTGAFPATGETGKIYVTTGDNRTYRWSGSTYVEISASPGSTDAVPEGSTNLYHTTARAAAAAPVQSVAGRTGAVTIGVADVSGAVASSDSRLTDTRTPTDASVTTAKLSPSLVVDGNALTLKFRRDTLANFTSANPTAALGEVLYETDTNRVKVGDGATAYTTLAYLTTGGGGGGGASPPSTLLDALTFNGSTTTFTLKSGGTNVTPTSAGNLIISLNGVIQQPDVAYTIAGSAITFSSAPAATDTFFGVLIGGNVPHTHDAADITSGTVATARLGSGTANSATFLRGDQTYSAPPVTSVDGLTGAITLTKAEVYEFTRSSKPASATGSNGNYAWTVPSGAKFLEFYTVAGGGGGGSGRRGAAGTACGGGGGGGSGDVKTVRTAASGLESLSLSVFVGAGGAGGAGVTANDTNGNNGVIGEGSRVEYASTGTAIVRHDSFGWRGSGGTTSGGTGGGGAWTHFVPGQHQVGGTGGNGVTAASGAAVIQNTQGASPSAGGGGGGISAAEATQAGGTSQTPYRADSIQSPTVGAAGGGNGGNGVTGFAMFGNAGGGGAGGGSSVSSAGGNGGNGAFPGGGGGGGGASRNGFTSGAGGNGGAGYVRITVWY